MDLIKHVFDTAVLMNTIAADAHRPTAFDLRQAEMRDLSLCRGCGKELTNVAYSAALLCGKCEEAIHDDRR